jgi:threonine/homoserine/homoserine lactone efflux protein
MNIEILIAFSIGMIVLAASPGPGVFASVSKAISDGFKSSLFLISGLVLGDVLFLILALIGMSTISKIMGEMFFTIKIAGGIYLVFLGIKAFKRSKPTSVEVKTGGKNKMSAFMSGLLVTLGNPKPILFYASVVPTIINIKDVHLIEALVMIAIIVSVSFLVIGTYCYIASLSKKIFIKNKFGEKLNKAAGLVMCAAGGYIIVK